jgi:4-diphosphocytidyl-2-C-methyl-D-erythritol kinase|tara:strand:- start:77 stop:916 length:840 start_codon:yes stop_codon:yes gene_type:complete
MIKSYCKLNLSLRVLRKLKNNLHNIQTNTVLIDLHDKIKISKTKKKKDIVNFLGIYGKEVDKTHNSINQSLSILRSQKIIKYNEHYKVNIIKRIPVFAGLGGGTSNAAFLIKFFYQNKLNETIIKSFEKKIGTDLRLFLYKQSFQKNLGKIKKYQKNFSFFFLLVKPALKCSTKHMYSKIKIFSKPSKVDFSSKIAKDEYINLLKKEQNDFQKVYFPGREEIQAIIDSIATLKGCYFSRMTGSGAVCFGMFKSKNQALLGSKLIKKKFPKYWCTVTKTI